jgi:hypothetical protein
VNFDPLIYNSAQIPVDLGLIVSMATRANQGRGTADIALLLFAPFYELQVGIALLHDWLSLIFCSTSFSWYRRASTPGFPDHLTRPLVVKSVAGGDASSIALALVEKVESTCRYGIHVCMRTTLNIDDVTLERASKLTGIKEKTRLLRGGLRALIQLESSRRLAKPMGM